jgi:hypothetical protein
LLVFFFCSFVGDADGFFSFFLLLSFCQIVLSEIAQTKQILALTHTHTLTHSPSLSSLKPHVLAHTPAHTPAHTNTHTTHTYWHTHRNKTCGYSDDCWPACDPTVYELFEPGTPPPPIPPTPSIACQRMLRRSINVTSHINVTSRPSIS